jgi:hypothetical protein
LGKNRHSGDKSPKKGLMLVTIFILFLFYFIFGAPHCIKGRLKIQPPRTGEPGQARGPARGEPAYPTPVSGIIILFTFYGCMTVPLYHRTCKFTMIYLFPERRQKREENSFAESELD